VAKEEGGKGGKPRHPKAPQSRSSRPGLQFPVGRVHRFLKEVTRDTALERQLPSTLQLFSSILQPKSWVGRECVQGSQVKRITPRHLQLAIRGDEGWMLSLSYHYWWCDSAHSQVAEQDLKGPRGQVLKSFLLFGQYDSLSARTTTIICISGLGRSHSVNLVYASEVFGTA
jgi:histone H2A